MKKFIDIFINRFPFLFAAGFMPFVLFFQNGYGSSMDTGTKTDPGGGNRLALEKSPYLQQHADDPVDWYPWGPEAFEKALKEDKPIFLSIGYSSCHWCHVMEHESFEDPEIARLMNEVFISIKVDREERPDIDSIYMTVSQILTGSGGWPLTIIMTPDKRPFFAATYIPREARFGKAGMADLIPMIQQLWKEQRGDILASADRITAALRKIEQVDPGGGIGELTIENAYEQLEARFDEEHGGFGTSPKFPSTSNLFFLLRYLKRTGDEKALKMVEKTLREMRKGGIYDHIGWGFHRYSTDQIWLVPHFEKMLYDQALLAMAYTEAYQVTGKEEYRKTASQVLEFVLREMTSPEDGFYTSFNADSEGEEGKFYLWTSGEIVELLGKQEADLISRVFNIKEKGNYIEGIQKTLTGYNIPHKSATLNELASGLKTSEQNLERRLEILRKKMYKYRSGRVWPSRDEKILTDWNGLMIAAFAKAAGAFEEQRYARAAERAAGFILKNMRTPEGRLLHRYKDKEAAISSQINDYAFLIWGLLELYETTFKEKYLQTAFELNKDMIEHFRDEKNGGFFSTPDDGEKLLVRKKEGSDGSLPSGNAVAMLNLLRLGRINASSGLEDIAAESGKAFSKTANDSPLFHTQLLTALSFAVGPSYEIVIVGKSNARDTAEMLRAVRSNFIPNKVIIFRPTNRDNSALDGIAGYTKEFESIDGKATAYVCQNYVCSLPTTDIDKMLELLNVN